MHVPGFSIRWQLFFNQIRQRGTNTNLRRKNIIARSGHYGQVPGNAWKFSKSLDRVFTIQYGRRYGIDVGLDDRMMLLSLSNKQRRLDDKKMKQIGEIFQRRLIEIIGCHESLVGRDLVFSKVQVDPSFSFLSVQWVCRGEGDEELEKLLEQERHLLRRHLSDSLGGGNVPEIKFIPDKTELRLNEMEQIFKQADYGVDYRTLSNTARVMGNVPTSDLAALSGANKERKPKAPPEWKRKLDEKKNTIADE